MAAESSMKIRADRRAPAGIVDEVDSAGGILTLTDTVFGFFEDGEGSTESCTNDRVQTTYAEEEDEDEEEEENSINNAERKAFWESQHQILKAALSRTSSLELRIRKDTEQALRDSRAEGPVCVCPKPVMGGCRNCFLRDVSDRLRKAGYDSAICKSKWRSSPDIPSGEHSYIDVVSTSSSKKSSVRVVIEVDFRAEFEMARASAEYSNLIDRLPQVFVGKKERLGNLIKILCGAAKTCMKENKMHMGPWRKHKYMQAKWLGTCERTTPSPVFSVGISERQRKRRASMLTFDLGDNLPSMHCTAVEVL
ncbi:hypothetical protein CKAN_02560500 [Cinnamomum micranthum f. kanehirae]|uniref:Uncharacterized protein n=1 Tax=Cinnamomum micranthum f. kanehirae TaxID=337451 RepID=A0A3S3NPN1_9MAGN|nr:hypothetical protein CKAN_02560500 [Cinnamomum micranthum f. kanehirae]